MIEKAEEKMRSCCSKPGNNGATKLPWIPEFKLSAPASSMVRGYDTGYDAEYEYDTQYGIEYGTDGTRYLSLLSRTAGVV